jgi:hypothetical protein
MTVNQFEEYIQSISAKKEEELNKHITELVNIREEFL